MYQAPDIPDDEIEAAALNFLAQCEGRYRHSLLPPHVVEEYIDILCDIEVVPDDLKTRFQSPNVIGAFVSVPHRGWRILYDYTLDPDLHPEMMGRFRFTIAHEVWHWILHRSLFKQQINQLDFFCSRRTCP